MNSKKAIQEELEALGSKLPVENAQPVFDLPEGYFENFAASVLAKVKGVEHELSAAEELNGLSPLLAGLPRTTPYTVPENYFSNLSQTIPALITEDEAPVMLQGMSKTLPYSVPDGYFENLPAQILSKLPKPETKIISMGSRRWMRYASAAMVAGLMAIAGIFYFNSGSKPSIDAAKQPTAWVASKLKDVSNKDLEEFIKTTDVTTASTQTAQSGVSTQDVRKLLNDVPDEDLNAFLSEVPVETEDLSSVN